MRLVAVGVAIAPYFGCGRPVVSIEIALGTGDAPRPWKPSVCDAEAIFSRNTTERRAGATRLRLGKQRTLERHDNPRAFPRMPTETLGPLPSSRHLQAAQHPQSKPHELSVYFWLSCGMLTFASGTHRLGKPAVTLHRLRFAKTFARFPRSPVESSRGLG